LTNKRGEKLIFEGLPLEEFQLRLEFTDNTTKAMDLKPYLHGPIFEPMRKGLRMFCAMPVALRLGILIWDNSADMAPDVLYKGHMSA
jgi:hypothetical protein